MMPEGEGANDLNHLKMTECEGVVGKHGDSSVTASPKAHAPRWTACSFLERGVDSVPDLISNYNCRVLPSVGGMSE